MGAFSPVAGSVFFEEKELFGLAGASDLKDGEKIALTYTIDGYLYGFETAVAVTGTETSSEGVLTIHPPRRIFRIERRKSYRAACPEDEPVKVLVHSGDEEIRTEALVISEESVGLSLPDDISIPAIDSSLTMTIGLPRIGDIQGAGTVRFIRDSSGSQGLVVRLDTMSDSDRDLLHQYLRSRRIETRNAEPDRREGSFLVTRHSNGRTYVFWCPALLMASIHLFDEALDVMAVETIEFL